MTPVTDPAILAQLNGSPGMKPVTDPAILAQLNGGSGEPQKEGPQPTFMDRMAGSPVGRLAHDAVVHPLTSAADLLTKFQLMGSGIPADKTDSVSDMLDKPYQAALAANRNTPGYAAARAQADKLMAAKGSGISDQLLAPLMPALAGIMGGLLGGSLDQANASADAQAAAQGAYAAANPIKSTIAGLVGGALAGPEMAKLPAALPKFVPTPALGNVLPNDAAQAQRYVLGLMRSSGKTPADLMDAAAAPAASRSRPQRLLGKLVKPISARSGGAKGRRATRLRTLCQSAWLGRRTASLMTSPQQLASTRTRPGETFKHFVDANKKAAGPLYDEAYAANTNVASPTLDRILETPAGKRALASAREKMQNDMSLMGTPDAELMEQAREGGTPLPSRGAASGMKLRVYDYVKKSLDDQISAAYRAGNNHEGSIIKDLKNKMVRELDNADVTGITGPNSVRPDGGAYARARAKAGEYLGAQEAFDAGGKEFLNPKISAAEFSDGLKAMTETNREAKKGGIANTLFNMAESGNLPPRLFHQPVIRQKLVAMVGEDKASALIKRIETEAKMAESARYMRPNNGSGTAGWASAMASQDQGGRLAAFGADAAGNMIRHGSVKGGLVRTAIDYAKMPVDAFLTRGMTVPVRDEAGRLLMLSPPELAGRAAQGLSPPTGVINKPHLTSQSRVPYGLFGSMGALQPQHQ